MYLKELYANQKYMSSPIQGKVPPARLDLIRSHLILFELTPSSLNKSIPWYLPSVFARYMPGFPGFQDVCEWGLPDRIDTRPSLWGIEMEVPLEKS